MTKNFRKITIFIVLVSMIGSLMAGCGSEPAASSASSTIAEKTTDTASPDSVAADEKVTISYWCIVPTQVQWKKIEESWNKVNPNIKVEYSTNASTDEFNKKMQVAMTAGEGPDLMETSTGNLKQYAPLLEEIQPLADKNWGTGWEDIYLPGMVEGSKDKDGRLVALPLNVESEEYVLFNKSLLDEIGVKGYDPAPKTYEEWKTLCDAIKAKGIIPVAYGGKDAWKVCDTFVFVANQFAPGKVYDAVEGKAKWTDPEFVDTMKAMKLLFDNIYQKGAVGINTYPDARDQYFYSRKAAMFITGNWHVGSYEVPGAEKYGTKIENDETSAFLTPQIGPNPAKPTIGLGNLISINKTSKNKEAAWKFFDFMTKGDGAQVMADALQGSPSRTDKKVQSLDLITHQAGRDSVNWLLSILPTAEGRMRLNDNSVQDALGAAIQNVVLGKSIESELKKVQEITDKSLRK